MEDGARWLHVVDMDRALRTGVSNGVWIRRICAIPGVHVQIGGNVDTAEWAGEAIEAGAARVVLGSAAAQSNQLQDLIDLVGLARAAVNIDVRGDGVALRTGGRVQPMTPRELACRSREHGVRTVVYRDLERDGRAMGADIAGAARLRREEVAVIAAGGVASLSELVEAARLELEGMIVGRALHEGRFTLREALACSP